MLKQDPSQGSGAAFQKVDAENKIVFPKFETKFDFKSISSSEDPIFDKVALPLIEDKFFKGIDSLLLTLGPTNSGKSHTLFKDENSILEQSLRTIFDKIDTLADNTAAIKQFYPNVNDATVPNTSCDTSTSSQLYLTISMFELYNDTVIDLFNSSMKTDRTNLGIVTDPVDHKLTPRNLSKYLVNSYEIAHEIVLKGLQNRKTFPTYTNSSSSRSHCFIFFNLHKVYGKVLETTRFSIVDLAGLERSKLARTSGASLREASYTNGSLTELGRCLELISMNQFQSTCLRTNKLTRLVLNGYVKNHDPVKILVTLDPFGEEGLILQTLRYIDPIKYQDLQRKSSAHLQPTSRAKLSHVQQHSLTSEIDNLRKNQKVLKTKIQSLETSMMEKEATIRNEIYKENEKALAKILMDHQTELTELSEKHSAQIDHKLQDQAQSFSTKIQELNVLVEQKQYELDASMREVKEAKAALEKIKKEFTELTTTFDELKQSSDAEIAKLLQRVELTSMKNDSLNMEVESLNLSINDMQADHAANIAQLESEKDLVIKQLRDQLHASNQQHSSLAGELEQTKETLCSKVSALQSIVSEQTSLKEKICHLESQTSCKESQIVSLKHELELNLGKYDEDVKNKENEISALNIRIETLKKEIEDQLRDLQQQISVKEDEIVSLASQVNQANDSAAELEKSKVCALQKLKETLDMEYGSEIEEIKQQLKQSEIELKRAANNRCVAIDEMEGEKVQLGKELDALKAELKEANDENLKLNNELKIGQERTVAINSKISKQLEKYTQEEASLKSQIKSLENNLKEEVERSESLRTEVIGLTDKLSEQVSNSAQVQVVNKELDAAKQKIDDKSAQIETLYNEKKAAEEELARLQMLCSDLKSTVSEKAKVTEKYVASKNKNKEYQAHIAMIEKDKKQLMDELQKSAEEIRKLKSRIGSFEKREADMFKAHVSADLDQALSQSSLDNQQIDKTPRKALNVLNTDPLDNDGLPPILSSPLRELPFEIHQDASDGNKKVPSPSKKKLRKEQKKDHEKMMDQQYTTSKSNKKMYKALVNTKLSELNKKSSPLSSPKDAKLKKRKSTSPLKPGKKRVRSSIGPEDSLEQLE